MCIVKDNEMKMFHEVTDVVFKAFDEAVIHAYMGKVDVMDKAGSYAIQECGDMILSSIQGSYSNVVGLPKDRVRKELEKFGIHANIA